MSIKKLGSTKLTDDLLVGSVNLSSEITGTLGVGNGGTGQTSYTDGQLLIGNTTGNTLAKSTLTAGTNVTITNGPGSITISAAGAASQWVTTGSNIYYSAGNVAIGTNAPDPIIRLLLQGTGSTTSTYGLYVQNSAALPMFWVNDAGNASVTNGQLFISGNTALHAGNYNSYAPSLTGSGASGTWGISVTGNAATVSSITSGQVTTALGYTPLSGNQTITLSGDATGSGATSIAVTLANSGVANGTYGGNNSIPRITVDLKGRITGVSTITPSGTWGIDISGNAANVTGTVAIANGGTGATSAAVALTNLGATTVGGNFFTLANPSAIGFVRVNADNTVSLLNGAGFRDAINVPTRTGGDASGTWAINITGNAATATTATSASNSTSTSQRAFSGDISTTGQGRFTGWYTGNAATGFAVEAGVSGEGYLIAYNRNTSEYGNLNINGTNIRLVPQGGSLTGPGGNVILHAGNYNSYAPTLTGGGASGTWSIRITGFANAGSQRLYSTDASYNYDSANPYFGYLTYIGANNRWRFQVSPATPAAVEVAYADSAGSVSGLTLNNNGSYTSPDSVTQNQLGYTNPVALFSQTDGGLYSSSYSSAWIHQIFGDFRSGQIAVRGKNNNSWQPWRVVLDSGNYTSYAPSIGGGSQISGGDSSYYLFGPNSTWGAYLYVGATTDKTAAGRAQVISTDGNLHIDGGRSQDVYVNYYSAGRPIRLYGATLHNNYGMSGVNSLALNNGFTISQGGSNYGSFNSWVFLSGVHGFYSSVNSAHFYPNDASYGAWRIDGSRNGYNGISFNGGNGQTTLMIDYGSSNVTGFHNQNYGWQFYWSSGTMYVFKNAYGGGTQATVLDSSNYSSYALPLSGGAVSGNIRMTGGGYGSDAISSSSPNSCGRVLAPAGGSASWDGTITGAIRIRLPFLTNDAMWHFTVKIYNYANRTIHEYKVASYSYSTGAYNVGVTCLNDINSPPLNVRIGNDGSYTVVWIGETSTSWSYPVVAVTDVFAGFRNCSASVLDDNWLIGYDTSFGTVGATIYPGSNTGNTYAYSYRGNSNVAGTGAASYHPDGIYSTGTNWLYGTMYLNRNNISGGGTVYMDNWFRSEGASGWYSQTYGGGIWMSDSTWVRVYGTKDFYATASIAAVGNITAYYSDERLKTKTGIIDSALAKVRKLTGFLYVENDTARRAGYKNANQQVGVSAQAVQRVLPEAVSLAPFDMHTDPDTGEITSKSGENYLTVDYSRLVPLLIEAIKELADAVEGSR